MEGNRGSKILPSFSKLFPEYIFGYALLLFLAHLAGSPKKKELTIT